MDKLKQEEKRLQDLLKRAEVPAQKAEALKPVINNMAFQKAKLEETMELMKDEAVVNEYDNGGDQKGIHENPLYKGYISLYKVYLQSLDKFVGAFPADMQGEAMKEATTSVLDKVVQMKRTGT